MKKKLMIVIVMLLVCTGMFILAQKAQNSIITSKKNKAEPSSTNENSKAKNVVEAEKKDKDSENVEPKKEEPKKEEPKPSPQSKEGSSSSNTNAVNTNVNVNTSSPKEEVLDRSNNFIIYDKVHGKVILQKKVEFDNEPLDVITCRLLEQAKKEYVNSGVGTSHSYFSSIAGLTEGEEGDLSGWCYYVNKARLPLGAGSYKYKKGDVIRWIYLPDGSKENTIDF